MTHFYHETTFFKILMFSNFDISEKKTKFVLQAQLVDEELIPTRTSP
jgi:hypothetical protein